ncbi:unnamed protein product [Periconia digitata]|uniref:Uncharacterized protein n=1 Tax=Periconia digitata TaxID=1303443 RepID=A0A9W4XMU7_9PLEO|nr:unnamed protein product [Periconia digitata]
MISSEREMSNTLFKEICSNSIPTCSTALATINKLPCPPKSSVYPYRQFFMASQSSIIWPDHFLPGTTDNFVSNETIARGISASQIWSLLSDISKWETYYKNCAQITAPDSGPTLQKGNMFKFSTFGFPPLTCTVEEYVEPARNTPGRIAWSSKTDEGLEIYHAWVVEDIEKDRVRILTQESQIGPIFDKWAMEKPNKMLLGHQDWLDGLVHAARGEEVGYTNLESVNFPVRTPHLSEY